MRREEATAGGITAPDKCPFNDCDGGGYILTSLNGTDHLKECKCLEVRRKQARVKKIFSNARIPRRFMGKRFDNFEPKNNHLELALQIARRYVEKFETLKEDGRNGLYLVGPTGTGKSHLAYAIMSRLIEEYQVAAVAGVVPELLDIMRPSRGKSQDAEERMDIIKSADLVLLDDLGAEKESDWVTERLFLLVNARYVAQLPTLITSNVPLEILQTDEKGKTDLAWERITSRIKEMCHIVVMDGEDFRDIPR